MIADELTHLARLLAAAFERYRSLHHLDDMTPDSDLITGAGEAFMEVDAMEKST